MFHFQFHRKRKTLLKEAHTFPLLLLIQMSTVFYLNIPSYFNMTQDFVYVQLF